MDEKYRVEMQVTENGKKKWVDCSSVMSLEDCWSAKLNIKLAHKHVRLRISPVKSEVPK